MDETKVDLSGWKLRIQPREEWQQMYREAWRLENGQRRIHRFEDRARFDGRMSFRERGRLMRMQNVQSARIWRMRHNGRCS